MMPYVHHLISVFHSASGSPVALACLAYHVIRLTFVCKAKELVWSQDPDEDHGDFAGSSEGRSYDIRRNLWDILEVPQSGHKSE